MKISKIISASIILLASSSSFAADGVSQNLSNAGKHSVVAVSKGAKASVQVGSAVIATPLIAAGVVGHASMDAGKALMNEAFGNEPLDVTDKTITAAPAPKKIMKAADRG